MASCMVELHIWSLKSSVTIRDIDVGCHTYHDKGETVVTGYLDQKQQYAESRDLLWTPKNRRPEKLRDLLKEVEDLLTSHQVVFTRWRSRRQFQVMLSNCVLLSFQVSAHSGDVERILIDKTLQGKFCSENINSAVVTDSFVVCTFPDKPKLGYAYFSKRPSSGQETGKKMDKMSSYDPKITHVDLPGVKTKRERKLSVNVSQEWVLVWCCTGRDDSSAWPWTPMTSDKERANVFLYAVNGSKLEELCFVSTEYEPLDVTFSHSQPRHIYTLEGVSSSTSGDYNVDTCIYECSKQGYIQRATVTTIPLKARVVAHGRNHSEDKLILGCSDGKLVLYDESKRVTQFVQSDLVSSLITWHPAGSLVLVSGNKGEIQCFDMALNPLNLLTVGETSRSLPTLQLTKCFRSPVTIGTLVWSHSTSLSDCIADAQDSLLMIFNGGPISILQLHLGVLSRGQLGPQELIQQYLNHQQINEAVNLLNVMNWNTDSGSCFTCLTTIINNLLKLPLNPDREAALEASLGSFYAPLRPLSEVIVVDYRDPISRLARRFFHYLLRYQRFEKAFLLAVDLHSRDLFMDIHYLALDKGEMALATVAKQKADEIEQEMPSESDNFDSLSDSVEEEDFSSDSYSSGSEDQPRPASPARATGASGRDEKQRGPGSSRASPEPVRAGRHIEREAWYQAEEQIDVAYGLGSDLEEIHLDASEGLASIPGDVYTQVLTDNPFGWDNQKPDDDQRSREAPEARGGIVEEGEGQERKEDGTTKTVKVIHFGMV
ncbi:WD repeat-containing and planar cell polarity effector protein fritz homolog [Patiria miniata]|uniref:WD repeat-containing and planar cell polarity effector protein fritz homolog n=1 Tax=Patiria miniata TaxID=46514 RepID=A0A913Z0A0_PATMI|nr:WD repeat-containing and planar cell polarity effector protein fritz homolog [Patiria miniata]